MKKNVYHWMSLLFYVLGGVALGYAAYACLFGSVDARASFTIMGLVSVPFLIATLLRLRFATTKIQKRRLMRALLVLCLTTYVLILINLLFLGSRANRFGSGSEINLVPFRSLYLYITALFTHSLNLNIALENLVGNVLLLMPLALCFYCLFRSLRKHLGRLVLSLLCVCLCIEGLQYLLQVGSLDVDDVILNMMGALALSLVLHTKRVKTLLQKAYLIDF